ncbi:hypothetical protein MVEN_00763000 [Mycena venus]|uniref:SAM domain-containing protein n=1 Tax=Mycena venus TaxID=2733690 RepID=A0A8H6YLZ0_9AGAR|nr:hypothetical protein MVEN_00763000 [Mycena venus]
MADSETALEATASQWRMIGCIYIPAWHPHKPPITHMPAGREKPQRKSFRDPMSSRRVDTAGVGGAGGPGLGPRYAPEPVTIDNPAKNQILDFATDEFCDEYRLGNDIQQLLVEQGFDPINALFDTKEDRLEELGFKVGQIAELRWALKKMLLDKYPSIRVVTSEAELTTSICGGRGGAGGFGSYRGGRGGAGKPPKLGTVDLFRFNVIGGGIGGAGGPSNGGGLIGTSKKAKFKVKGGGIGGVGGAGGIRGRNGASKGATFNVNVIGGGIRGADGASGVGGLNIHFQGGINGADGASGVGGLIGTSERAMFNAIGGGIRGADGASGVGGLIGTSERATFNAIGGEEWWMQDAQYSFQGGINGADGASGVGGLIGTSERAKVVATGRAMPSNRPELEGGQGGVGGWGDLLGGAGGLGGAPQVSVLYVAFFSKIAVHIFFFGGGIGGAGGPSAFEGGQGGDGEGPICPSLLFPIDEYTRRRIPRTPLDDFSINPALRTLLQAQGFQTVGGLLEAYDTDVQAPQFKPGHAHVLTGALSKFVALKLSEVRTPELGPNKSQPLFGRYTRY